jgi:hypothetical protein
MKLELKNVKINETFSEETLMFMADLFVDGKKVGYANNDGRGGCTCYNAYEGQREVLGKAEAFAKSLPSTFHDFGGKEFEFKSSLESWIDDAVNKIYEAKAQAKADKKMQKLMETQVVWGVPNGNTYKHLGFKHSIKLDVLSPASIKNLVDAVKSRMLPNEEIFNKNIPI